MLLETVWLRVVANRPIASRLAPTIPSIPIPPLCRSLALKAIPSLGEDKIPTGIEAGRKKQVRSQFDVKEPQTKALCNGS